jgi:hypothetical protein
MRIDEHYHSASRHSPPQLRRERKSPRAAAGAGHADEDALLLLFGEVGAVEHAGGLLLEQLMQRQVGGDDAVVGRERGFFGLPQLFGPGRRRGFALCASPRLRRLGLFALGHGRILSSPAPAGEGDHLAQQDGGGGAGRDVSLAATEVPRGLRPLHRASRGPPPPLSRVRIKAGLRALGHAHFSAFFI